MNEQIIVTHRGLSYKIKISQMEVLKTHLLTSIELENTLYNPYDTSEIQFTDLLDKINEKFPTTQGSSNNTYYQNLKAIMKALDFEVFSVEPLRDFSKVKDTIDSMTTSNNTKSAYYYVITKAFTFFDLDAPKIYWDKIEELKKVKADNKFNLSDKERNMILKLNKDLPIIEQRLLNNLEHPKCTPYQKQKLFLFYAYTETPPLRRDWCNILLDLEPDEKKQNWLDTKNFIIHMNHFKNIRSSGPYTFDIKNYPNTLKALKTLLESRQSLDKGDNLILSTKNKPITGSNFNKALHSVFFKGIGCDLLRKLYINQRVDQSSVAEELEIARIMRHNLSTRNDNYIKAGLDIKTN